MADDTTFSLLETDVHWQAVSRIFATKDHIRLRPIRQAQGFGGQEEHRGQYFFALYVIFGG